MTTKQKTNEAKTKQLPEEDREEMEMTRGDKECLVGRRFSVSTLKKYILKGGKIYFFPQIFFLIEIPNGLHSLNKSTAHSDSSLLLGFVCLLLINRTDVIFLSVWDCFMH